MTHHWSVAMPRDDNVTRKNASFGEVLGMHRWLSAESITSGAQKKYGIRLKAAATCGAMHCCLSLSVSLVTYAQTVVNETNNASPAAETLNFCQKSLLNEPNIVRSSS